VALRDALAAALAEGERGVARFAARHGVATAAFPADPADPFVNINDPVALARLEAGGQDGGGATEAQRRHITGEAEEREAALREQLAASQAAAEERLSLLSAQLASQKQQLEESFSSALRDAERSAVQALQAAEQAAALEAQRVAAFAEAERAVAVEAALGAARAAFAAERRLMAEQAAAARVAARARTPDATVLGACRAALLVEWAAEKDALSSEYAELCAALRERDAELLAVGSSPAALQSARSDAARDFSRARRALQLRAMERAAAMERRWGECGDGDGEQLTRALAKADVAPRAGGPLRWLKDALGALLQRIMP
jgi:hypothetical protein